MLAYLSISDRHLQQLFEVFIAFLILVTSLTPLGNSFSVEDENMEEGVQKQDDIRFNRDAVEKNWLWGSVEGVGHQGRLDHDPRIVNIFLVQHMPRPFVSPLRTPPSAGYTPIECCFIRRVVEHL